MSAALHPACDRAIAQAAVAPAAQAGAPGASPPHPRWVVATTVLASSLAFIDGSVVNVGLPAIGASLGADGAGLSWVVNAYLLPLSALLLIGGAAGDRYGRRRLLLIGIALFAAASLLCAAAPGLGWLLAGRALLGVGAALLMPNSLAILGASFSGAARGRAIGTWAAAGAAAGAIGPVIGGWLIDGVGWRAIFLVNLPIAAAALLLGAVAIRAEPAADPPALDLPGAALASAGLAGLTWGLTVASAQRGLDLRCALALGTGALALLLFLSLEQRRGEGAMLPLALFSSRSFVGLNLLTFLLYGALGALLVLVPYLLIQAQGYAAAAAGAALLPLALVIAVASPTMGRIAAVVGARLPLTIGPAIVAGGFLLALRIDAAASYWTSTFPALLVVALGMAGAVAPLTTAVLAAVEARHNGVAAGFNSAVARTGGLIATALLGSILGTQGAALEAWFRLAMLIGAAVALAAAACAFAWLKPR